MDGSEQQGARQDATASPQGKSAAGPQESGRWEARGASLGAAPVRERGNAEWRCAPLRFPSVSPGFPRLFGSWSCCFVFCCFVSFSELAWLVPLPSWSGRLIFFLEPAASSVTASLVYLRAQWRHEVRGGTWQTQRHRHTVQPWRYVNRSSTRPTLLAASDAHTHATRQEKICTSEKFSNLLNMDAHRFVPLRRRAIAHP